jgi:Tfp pilus assembly protein PilF
VAQLVQSTMNISAALALATQSQRAGDLPRAEQIYREVLAVDPQCAEAWNMLGVFAQQTGQSAAAVELIRRAIAADAHNPAYHSNLGTVYKSLGRLAEATDCLQHALRLAPHLAMVHFNLGTTLQDRELWDEAVASYQRALEIEPDLLEAGNNLGSLLARQGRLTEAVEHYEHCLRLDPQSAKTRWNRAFAWLRLGNFEQGWPEYEWRFQLEDVVQQRFNVSMWDGSPLQGRTILLHAEQGLGDTVQFVRFAAQVQERGGRVVLACQRPLVRLFQTCPGIDQVLATDEELPPFDVQAPLLSLPRILGTTLKNLPAKIPYLFADEGLEQHWRQELSGLEGMRIGVVWQGNPQHPDDRNRSFRLSEFLPIALVPGVQLISLQKGFGSEQLAELAGQFSILDLGARLDETTGPFLDTAAALRQLDLVIAPDTMTVHLAGALGVPVWTVVSAAPDWRWLVGREDCPWYPTMRVFQQKRSGDWPEVFARMAEEIERMSRS